MPHLQPLFTFMDPVSSAVASGGTTTVHMRPPLGGASGDSGAPPLSTVRALDSFDLEDTGLDAGACAAENRSDRLMRILSGDLGHVVTTANVMFDDRAYDEATARARGEVVGPSGR